MSALPSPANEAAAASADPAAARVVLERLAERPEAASALEEAPDLSSAVATVAAASRALGRLLVSEPEALFVLGAESALGGAEALARRLGEVRRAATAEELARQKQLGYLVIAAADLNGSLELEEVGAALSHLADAVLEGAVRLAGAGGLAVVGMGKHGAEELNYASDVDIVFVAPEEMAGEEAAGAARRVLQVAGAAYRIDTDLRPEGRNGALARSLQSYSAYWERWARPWEFQALLKARPAAGDRALGEAFAAVASEAVWSRRFDAEALDELRSMKGRAEQAVARRGLSDRELKRGPGGIRDIEFAVQLLQLVHGGSDPALRQRATLAALAELANAGYVEGGDAAMLALAYRFLRTIEHRLQLVEGAQVHTVPAPGAARNHLARVVGLGPLAPRGSRSERFDLVLGRYQSSVRSIHERLFFRPLLEVFSSDGAARLSRAAAEERLAAFGFKETERTKEALRELTRGLTRSSRLMQQLLPVLLGWLSESPDPDAGLLALRNLVGLPHRRDVVVAAFRDSPELARRLCLLSGTSRRLGELAQRDPGLALRLGDDSELAPPPPQELRERLAAAASVPRQDPRQALRRTLGHEVLRLVAGDLLGLTAPSAVAGGLAALGDALLGAALQAARPRLGFAIVAMGRLGGEELSYGSDLDVIFLYEGEGASDRREAERVADELVGLMNGDTPAHRLWTVDTSLRPEGRQGPLARSLAAYREYHERWISAWERQALLRARPVAGDPALLSTFMALCEKTLWERPLSPEDIRQIRRLKARTERERIPAGEDPQFHFKLGKGSLADIEWTVQLLQLESGLPGANTAQALSALAARGALEADEAAALGEALSALSRTRARWHLVGNYVAPGSLVPAAGSDSLPSSKEGLARLARSLQVSPGELREQYRRVTRRARRVVERRFYGL